MIKSLVHRLVMRYKTSDPFELADHLNIYVRYADTDGSFKGVYMPVNDKQLIILNDNYRSSKEGFFVMAHELYHAIEHREQVNYYHHGHLVKGKKEREANQFATYLLLEGVSVYEEQSSYDVLRDNYIPHEMEPYIRSV